MTATSRTAPPSDLAEAAGRRGPLDRWRILIADDQPEHLEMLARAIAQSDAGCAIDLVRAVDGQQALDQIRAGIDLAFLDIRMPGRTGLEVVAAMRADPALHDVPVVIVSSSSDPRDVQEAERLGAVAYVEKGRFRPFRQTIGSVLETVLDGSGRP